MGACAGIVAAYTARFKGGTVVTAVAMIAPEQTQTAAFFMRATPNEWAAAVLGCEAATAAD
jgi:hypothetical protein